MREIVNEVRLVEVPAFRRHRGPVDRKPFSIRRTTPRNRWIRQNTLGVMPTLSRKSCPKRV